MCGKTKCKVWLMFLHAKRQQKMSIRRLWKLKTKKQANFDVFLGKHATRKVLAESHLEDELQNLKYNRHI